MKLKDVVEMIQVLNVVPGLSKFFELRTDGFSFTIWYDSLIVYDSEDECREFDQKTGEYEEDLKSYCLRMIGERK